MRPDISSSETSASGSNHSDDRFLDRLDAWQSTIGSDFRLRRLLPLVEDPGSLSLETAARAAAFERCSFSRYFHGVVGARFRDWRTALKVSHAMKLLQDTTRCVETIALAVGFGDARSLRRAMNRYLGVGPAEFRLASGIDEDESVSASGSGAAKEPDAEETHGRRRAHG